MTRRLKLAALVVTLAIVAGATVLAQRRAGGGFGPPQVSLILPNTKYDGRFTFVRLRYGPPVAYASQRVFWSHDYPTGERNFMSIMNEVTYLAPHVEETNVISFSDPELFKYPLAYLCEPGPFFQLTDEEVNNFRSYLLKGGFLIVDDFRFQHWEFFEAQMRRVFPDVRFFDLDENHPIFHSFFEIDKPTEYPNMYDQGKPIYRGIYENNDPTKRLLAIINFNTDISEWWEFSGTGLVSIESSNDAYKLGVNYIIYGMTH